jgi:RNA polymerase sigma-70 factor (ECF subfamily)
MKQRDRNPAEQTRDRSAHEASDYAPLVVAAQTGSPAAMEQLLLRAQEVAYRFSLLVCGGANDADDAMQEAMIKTYRYATRIREPAAFRTWLYRTVKNACLIGRRRRVHEPALLVSLDAPPGAVNGRERSIDAVDPGRGPEEAAMNSRLRRRLSLALGQLPRAYRLVIVLRDIEGLTTREVAGVAGISEANVKTRLHRARLMLRQVLENT